jgi:hypothetical protein
MHLETLIRDLEIAFAGVPMLDIHTLLVEHQLGSRGLHHVPLSVMVTGTKPRGV